MGALQTFSSMVAGAWQTPVGLEFPIELSHLAYRDDGRWRPMVRLEMASVLERNSALDSFEALVEQYNQRQLLNPSIAHVQFEVASTDGLPVITPTAVWHDPSWVPVQSVFERLVEFDVEDTCERVLHQLGHRLDVATRPAGAFGNGALILGAGRVGVWQENCSLQGEASFRHHLRTLLRQVEDLGGEPSGYVSVPGIVSGEDCDADRQTRSPPCVGMKLLIVELASNETSFRRFSKRTPADGTPLGRLRVPRRLDRPGAKTPLPASVEFQSAPSP